MKHCVEFLEAHSAVVKIQVVAVKGSTPREAGAFMLVSRDAAFGTIGGGALELDAIIQARSMLETNTAAMTLKFTLGTQINQCCGGKLELKLNDMNEDERQAMIETARTALNQMPNVLVFGAGHVGRALALALAPLPFRVSLIDVRPHALLPKIHGVNSLALPVPEQAVREAPPASSFVVMTHEHSLDFLIVNEALKRKDAAYIGLIGSKTKKAVFRSQYLADGGTLIDFAFLTCPIGANPTGDKRPEVIAAFVATELCMRLLASKSRDVYAFND